MPKELLGTTTGNSVRLKSSDLGPPGSYSVLTLEPEFPGCPQTRWEEDETQREFVVSASLVRSPLPSESMNLSLSASEGSSYFVAPPSARMQIGSPGGVFDVFTNERGELSYVEFNTNARTWHQASDAFSFHFGSILSHLSYAYNVPAWLGRMVTRDKKYEVQVFEYFSPYVPSKLKTDAPVLVQVELDPIYALYREGINSHSPYYRMLCFYKIMEGVLRSLRPALRKRAQKAGINLTTRVEVVPLDPDFPAEVREWTGKSITSFYDKVLTRQFRDAVAHFTLRDTGLLHLGSPKHVRAFSSMVRACEVCARLVISNHEADLSEMHSKGAA